MNEVEVREPVVLEPTTPRRIEVATGELHDALAQVKHGASKDYARPVLTTVAFEADGDRLRFVAADNYRIATTTIEAYGDVELIAPALLIVTDLASLLPFLKAKGEFERCVIERTDERLSFAVGTESASYRLMDGSFPKWRAIVPTGAGKVTSLNVKYLADLKNIKPVTRNVHLVIREWNEPIEVYAHKDDPYREYVMPVRTEDNGPA